jgi:hypothetical protein
MNMPLFHPLIRIVDAHGTVLRNEYYLPTEERYTLLDTRQSQGQVPKTVDRSVNDLICGESPASERTRFAYRFYGCTRTAHSGLPA